MTALVILVLVALALAYVARATIRAVTGDGYRQVPLRTGSAVGSGTLRDLAVH